MSESMTAARSSVSIAASGGVRTALLAIGPAGEVGLVGPRAIVVRASGSHGQAQGHRVQTARVVARQLQALDVGGQRRGVTADALGRLAAAQGQQFADRPVPVQKRRDGLEHGCSIAEPEGTTRALEPAARTSLSRCIPSGRRSSPRC